MTILCWKLEASDGFINCVFNYDQIIIMHGDIVFNPVVPEIDQDFYLTFNVSIKCDFVTWTNHSFKTVCFSELFLSHYTIFNRSSES